MAVEVGRGDGVVAGVSLVWLATVAAANTVGGAVGLTRFHRTYNIQCGQGKVRACEEEEEEEEQEEEENIYSNLKLFIFRTSKAGSLFMLCNSASQYLQMSEGFDSTSLSL